MGRAERHLLDAADAIVDDVDSLAEQRDEFEAILRSMAEAVVVTGARGEVILLNGAARRIFALGADTDYRARAVRRAVPRPAPAGVRRALDALDRQRSDERGDHDSESRAAPRQRQCRADSHLARRGVGLRLSRHHAAQVLRDAARGLHLESDARAAHAAERALRLRRDPAAGRGRSRDLDALSRHHRAPGAPPRALARRPGLALGPRTRADAAQDRAARAVARAVRGGRADAGAGGAARPAPAW